MSNNSSSGGCGCLIPILFIICIVFLYKENQKQDVEIQQLKQTQEQSN